MNNEELNKILARFKAGEIDAAKAGELLKGFVAGDGYMVDTQRKQRTGCVEVMYCAGKTAKQIEEISRKIVEANQCLLATRVTVEQKEVLAKNYPQGHWNETAKVFRVGRSGKVDAKIAVLCAGTSDMSVAEEAKETAFFVGVEVVTIYDCGVAGIHRLLNNLDVLKGVKAIVVAAGMEGALPSVVGGLVSVPVIAVPTSVGYGASFHGLAALLGMLNSCANGVSVVNIDNGFGAGYNAALIAKNNSQS
jgi:NCAIR mutase (PurE)-related protein